LKLRAHGQSSHQSDPLLNSFNKTLRRIQTVRAHQPRMRSDLPSSTSTRSFNISTRYKISTFHIKLRYRTRLNIP
jgi:hypothetical protein